MLDMFLGVAKSVLGRFVPGGADAIEAAAAVVDLARFVREGLDAGDQAALDSHLAQLLEDMNIAVDRAVAASRGTH